MSNSLARAEILAMLGRWELGEVSTSQIHAWAEDHYLSSDFPIDDYESTGPEENSVANEVLAYLDMLDQHLGLPEDASMHIRFLKTPPGSFAAGHAEWIAAQDQINFTERGRRLWNVMPYARYFLDGPPPA